MQHNKLHDSLSHNGSFYVNYTRPPARHTILAFVAVDVDGTQDCGSARCPEMPRDAYISNIHLLVMNVQLLEQHADIFSYEGSRRYKILLILRLKIKNISGLCALLAPCCRCSPGKE